MALPDEQAKVGHVRDMFDRIAPRYDLVNRIMTFGLDTLWRRKSATALGLPQRSTVLDIACGTGDFCRDLARAGHFVVGLDLSLGMLKAARTEAPLAQADTFSLPVKDSSVDAITCGFALRNFASIPPALDEFARVLRPGGRVALLEVAKPTNALLAFGHSIYFGKVVPRIGGLMSDKAAYRYLPESVSYLPEPDELCSMITNAGFDSIDHTMMFTGAAQLFTATRR
jgi:demethylmenaquinone methyltransferase/2-methoxy-6-polyprenyl-1,4-benzoquinol methylase